MTEQTLIAVITAVGVLGAAGIGWLTAAQARTAHRLRAAESGLSDAAVTNHSLWEYTRLLIDAHYTAGLGPPPPPPDHIKHLYQSGD